MNIHPLFVHFPIALLTLYSVVELLRFTRLRMTPGWVAVKNVLLITGALGAFVAFETGEIAKELLPRGESMLFRIVEAHSTAATVTLAIYGVIAGAQILLLIARFVQPFLATRGMTALSRIFAVLLALAHFFDRTAIAILLALAGLVAVTLTGALGGLMVYGPGADPFLGLVFRIFFAPAP